MLNELRLNSSDLVPLFPVLKSLEFFTNYDEVFASFETFQGDKDEILLKDNDNTVGVSLDGEAVEQKELILKNDV